uniref:Uncharacterized protein n=1 Tax=Ananas comosus var. bracteatus TaxID=296719 RepID=A0A6V7P9W8_ANACO|nr:unnamed protein product [Ananas comosus var. bracteatus]
MCTLERNPQTLLANDILPFGDVANESLFVPLRPHFPFALTTGRGLSSPLIASAPVVASPPLAVASPPVIASPPLASPALRPHLRPHHWICLLPTSLHSGRTSSHSARSPSPKPLHRRICLLLTPLHSGRTFTAGPKPFPETPSPPNLPPPDAPPLRPKHFTSGPKPFPEAPSPLALSPPDTLSLRSNPFTSGSKPLHLPPKPLTAGQTPPPPASPPPEALHVRLKPSTPVSPTPEASSCPEGRNRNFLVAAGWTIICPAPCVGRTLCLGLDWPRLAEVLRACLLLHHCWLRPLREMRPFKKLSKSKQKQGVLADESPIEASSGRYAFTSAVELPPIIESSSRSSPGEDNTIAGIRMSACNLLSEPFEAEASGCARYANNAEANTSRSPSPPVMRTTGASGSGHRSGNKRARSP